MGETPESIDTLDGWKEIAAYLRRSVRSAQRWEEQLGLPVYRIPTPDGGMLVFARRSEVDDWRGRQAATPSAQTESDVESELESEPPPEAAPESGPAVAPAMPPEAAPDAVPTGASVPLPSEASASPRRGLMALVTTVTAANLAGAVLLVVPWRGETLPPVTHEVQWQRLQALDAERRVVWSHDFDGPISYPSTLRPGPRLFQTDLEGDGLEDSIAVLRHAPRGERSSESDAVYAFDSRGRLRWRVQPRVVLRDNARTYEGPWEAKWATVSAARPGFVWVAYTHHTWRPSFVLEIAPDGSDRVRYVQEGWIRALSVWESADGLSLAATGAATEDSSRTPDTRAEASVALMHLDDPPARFLIDPSNTLTCDECPTGEVRRVVLFPPNDVMRALSRAHGWGRTLIPVSDGLLVHVDTGLAPSAIAHVDGEGRVVDYRYATRHWEAHRQLYAEGRIDHSADICPLRSEPAQMREWTPEGGWREYLVQQSREPAQEASLTQD